MSKWSIVFAVLMSFLIISTSQAQEVREAVYNSNIRSCAGTSQQGCSIVGTISRGTTMTVLDSTQSAYGGGTTWYNVQAGGMTGWILGRLTRVSQAPPAAQGQPAQPAQQQSDNKCYEGWVCTTDADWERGYWAKQAELQGQPSAPAISAPAPQASSHIDSAWERRDWQTLIDGIVEQSNIFGRTSCISTINLYRRETDIVELEYYKSLYYKYCRP